MKKISACIILIQIFVGGCTLRSETTSSTVPATETTSYNTRDDSTSVTTPVSVTKTTETTSMQ